MLVHLEKKAGAASDHCLAPSHRLRARAQLLPQQRGELVNPTSVFRLLRYQIIAIAVIRILYLHHLVEILLAAFNL